MNAVWYFDLVSPFAYLALGEVEALASDVSVTFKPVLFGAILSHWGQLGPAEIPPKRVQTYRLCVFTARERGIPFRFPPSHPFNPLTLLRILTALEGRHDAVRTVFDLIWREGRDFGAEKTLDLARQRLGIGNFESIIEARDAKAKLRAETEAAIASACSAFQLCRSATSCSGASMPCRWRELIWPIPVSSRIRRCSASIICRPGRCGLVRPRLRQAREP
ncbi:MAG: DsbA family protein [Hyphomicrobiales bacterium]|nr:DsbA family protein [Hyphomicrobiales bacterium]